MDRRWKEAALAWGVVNLLFFRRWAQILPGGHDYFLEAPRGAAEYVALMVLIVVLSAVAFGAVWLARHSERAWALNAVRGVFLVAAAIGIGGVIAEGWVFLGRPAVAGWLWVVGLVAAAGGAVALHRRVPGWHRRVVGFSVALMFLFVPLVPIMYVQGAYQAAAGDAAGDRFFPQQAPLVDAGTNGTRVLWLLLDEFDQRLAFEERPEGYALPEFDRLRAESLVATHAYAPNAATLRSLPSMTTGRLVETAQPYAIDGLRLTYRDSDKEVEWRDADTVFHHVREGGGNVGIVGTYHPYCRLFADVVSDCRFEGHYAPATLSWGDRVKGHLLGLTRSLPTTTLYRIFWDGTGLSEEESEGRQQREIHKYHGLAPAARELAADPGLDLVFAHLNVPHPTGMRGASRGYYDADTAAFSLAPNATYFDNLVLADKTMGQIRADMEASGVWNKTTVIVTSDHGYRAGIWGESAATEPFGDLLLQPTDHRVVFMVKPAQVEADADAASGVGTGGAGTLAATGVVYEEPFNLVLLRGMVEAARLGDWPDPGAVADWLDAHRTIGPAPYYKVY